MSLSNFEYKILDLAARFLEEYDNRLGNDHCNDWSWPADWTEDEKKRFVKAYYEKNGIPEEYDENHLNLPNFGVVWMISIILKNAVELRTLGERDEDPSPQ